MNVDDSELLAGLISVAIVIATWPAWYADVFRVNRLAGGGDKTQNPGSIIRTRSNPALNRRAGRSSTSESIRSVVGPVLRN